MGKKILITCILIILFLFGIVNGDGIENLIEGQLEHLSLESLQEFANRINSESGGLIPQLNIKDIIKMSFNKNHAFSIKELLNGIWRYIMIELLQNMQLLGKIIILSVFCAIFQNLHSGFQNESIGRLAYSICYVMIIILAVQSFGIVSKTCIETIDSMVLFMQSLLPILITLLLSVGGITSSSLFQPIVYTSVTAISTFIKTVVIPLVIFSSVLSIISNISEKIRITRLASLIRGIAIALLGIVLTAFTGVISVQGLAASSLDGVMAKSAKFAVDSFIPIIGDFLSEAFDTVISCSLLIKNSISIAGLFILLLITLLPIIKILAIFLSYKISAALIQPIIDNELVQSLNDISNSILVLLCCMISVGILFFIAITIIMGIGNITVMMR